MKKEGRKKGGREGGRKERKETSGVACVDKKKKKKEKKYSKPIFEHRIVLFIKPSPCNRDTEGIVSFFFRIDKVYSFVRACFVKLLLVKYARLIYR